MQYKGMTEVHVCQMSPDSLPNTGFYYEQERRWLSDITKTWQQLPTIWQTHLPV